MGNRIEICRADRAAFWVVKGRENDNARLWLNALKTGRVSHVPDFDGRRVRAHSAGQPEGEQPVLFENTR